NLKNRICWKPPLNVEIPGFRIRHLLVSVDHVHSLTKVRQQSGRAARRRTEARWEWIGEHSIRRQTVVQTGSNGRGADKAGGRHPVTIPAASPGIGVEHPISTAKYGCVREAVRKTKSRCEVLVVRVPVSPRQAAYSGIHRASADNRPVRQCCCPREVEIRNLVITLRARSLVVPANSEIQA